jgi:hypothetical protein
MAAAGVVAAQKRATQLTKALGGPMARGSKVQEAAIADLSALTFEEYNKRYGPALR